ncbi:hypothetical protein BC940DRAFT_334451 [Gongronella butleri]|nr:hypothetical protein BC940DRAFT_334451 [Gongronella butleri]
MSEKDKREWQTLFDTIDKDSDHKISMAEIRTALFNKGITEQQFQMLAAKAYTDANEYLSFDDFARLVQPMLEMPSGPTERQRDIYKVVKFMNMDEDSDDEDSHVNNAEQLQKMMRMLGEPVSIDVAQQLIDTGGDDEMNIYEFSQKMLTIAKPFADHIAQTQFSVENTRNKRFSIRRFFGSLFRRKHDNYDTY